MSYVLGIDPGLATGMALYNLGTCQLDYAEETGNGVKGFTRPFLETWEADIGTHVACEGFTLRAKNKFTAGLQGVEIIGWLKGEDLCSTFPEPIQHMSLTKLREKKDKYQDSVITHMFQGTSFKIGKGHTRMALSVAVWYAAMILKHEPTLAMLKPKEVN